jgi:hypothetical protein
MTKDQREAQDCPIRVLPLSDVSAYGGVVTLTVRVPK